MCIRDRSRGSSRGRCAPRSHGPPQPVLHLLPRLALAPETRPPIPSPCVRLRAAWGTWPTLRHAVPNL
eukprot:2435446-Alexandrium_andersonii.AAC.1